MQKFDARYIYAAILSLVFMGFLGGCSDPLNQPPASGEDLKDRGAVQLSISGGTEGARTLLPSAAFSKYVLSFIPGDGQDAEGDLPWTAESYSQRIYLPLGNWTIRATAYVTADGQDYPAAYGETSVYIQQGYYTDATIVIGAPVDGETGTLNYSIALPTDGTVSGTLEKVGDPGVSHAISSGSGTISPASGIYLLKLTASSNGKTVTRTEVVYIYGNSATEANYIFSKADFGSPLTIGGTIQITDAGGSSSDSYSIYVYADENYRQYIAGKAIQVTDTSWSFTLPSVQGAQRLYFRVQAGSADVNAESIEVPVEDKTDIDLGTFAFITLSGTVTVPAELDLSSGNFYVYVFTGTGNNLNWIRDAWIDTSSGAWSMKLPAFESAANVSFVLYSSYPIYGLFSETAVSRSVYNQGISGIDLTLAKTETGSDWVDKTTIYYSSDSSLFIPDEDGKLVLDVRRSNGSGAWVYLYDARSGAQLAYSSDSSNPHIEYTLEAGHPYIVSVQGFNGAYQMRAAFINAITLSGTVNLTINSVKPASGEIGVYAQTGDALLGTGQIDVNANTWSASVLSQDADTPVYFILTAYDNNGSELHTSVNPSSAVIVRDASISGIALGSVNISAITLSGTVNPSSVKLAQFSQAFITARRSDQSSVGNAHFTASAANDWSMKIASFASPEDLDFTVNLTIGSYTFSHPVSGSESVGNTDKSGINLSLTEFAIGGAAAAGSVDAPYTGGWFLVIPDRDGTLRLDAISSSLGYPYMHLYDGETGMELASDYASGGNGNSLIRYTVSAGHPYLALIRAYSSGTGDYTFQAEYE